jgi:hypothetical protein
MGAAEKGETVVGLTESVPPATEVSMTCCMVKEKEKKHLCRKASSSLSTRQANLIPIRSHCEARDVWKRNRDSDAVWFERMSAT